MKNRQARYMTSKFRSHCASCESAIDEGERIYYAGRGRAFCMSCAPAELNAAPAKAATPRAATASEANSWSSMLSWNDQAPERGASIGQASKPSNIRANPVPAAQPEKVPDATQTASGAASDEIAIAYSNTSDSTQSPRDSEIDGKSLIDQVLSNTAEQAASKEPDERYIAIISDQVVTLINALSQASAAERAAIETMARKQAERSPVSRANLWFAVADMITA